MAKPVRKVRPIFIAILGGVLVATAYVLMRKPKELPPRFEYLPPQIERITAGEFYSSLPKSGKDLFYVIQRVASETSMPPILLASILDVESRFGDALTPPGPTGTGDRGYGHGLMQIDSRSHAAFLSQRLPSGIFKWQDPYENMKYGAGVFKSAYNYFRQTPSDRTVTVRRTDTAAKKGVPPGTYTDPRPLSNDEAILAAIAAYNAGAYAVLQALAAGVPADTVTVSSLRGNVKVPYLANVLASANDLLSKTA